MGGSPEVQGPESEKLVKPLHHHTGSVQCGVEYVVVYDTEYKEEAFQTCDTVYQQICQVESERLCQNTTRGECQLVQDQVCNTEYKKVSEMNTRLWWSHTQKQNVSPTIKMTVSTIGK